MSGAALADIEALRASERLQGIFASGPRPDPGRGQRAPGLGPVPTEAGGTRRRALVGSRRAWGGVGLIAVIFGIGVLAIGVTGLREDMARVAPVAEFLVQAVGGAPDAAVAGGQAPQTPRAAETQHDAAAEVSGVPATAGPLRAEAPQPAPSKSADDLAKSMDLAAIIRERVAAARTTRLRDVPGVESPGLSGVAGEPAVPLTVPQPTWAPQAAAPVSVPAPRRQARSTAPTPPAPRLEAVETIPQPRADTGPGETSPAEAPGPGEIGLRVAAEDAPAGARPADAARIVLHYRGAAGEETARRLASTLRTHGLGRAELRRVSAYVAQANIRFFYAENRPVAGRVGALLRAMGRDFAMRDFTHYSPLPSNGTVEVWLPG